MSSPSGSALYTTWRSGGACAMLFKTILSQLTMVGVLVLVYLLTTGIDYSALRHHLDHPLCPTGHVPNQASLFDTDCFGNQPINMQRRPNGVIVFVLFSAAVTMVIELVASLVAVYRVHDTDQWCRSVGLASVWDMPWDEVCNYVTPMLDDTVAFRESIVRRPNYFIELYSTTLKELNHIPRTLHAAINVARLLKQYTNLSSSTCCTLVGAGSFFALPALFVGTMCHYVFRNSAVLRTGSSGIGTLLTRRSWSRRAAWIMRRESELDHEFDQRAEEASVLASHILSAMPVPHWVITLANATMVLCGAFTTVVLLLTVVVDDQVVATNLSAGRTTAFYAAIAGTLMAVSAPCIIRPVPIDLSKTMIELRDLVPSLLQGASTLDDQCAVVSKSMQYWVEEFWWELISLFTTPFTMCMLPASRII